MDIFDCSKFTIVPFLFFICNIDLFFELLRLISAIQVTILMYYVSLFININLTMLFDKVNRTISIYIDIIYEYVHFNQIN